MTSVQIGVLVAIQVLCGMGMVGGILAFRGQPAARNAVIIGTAAFEALFLVAFVLWVFVL